MSRALFLCTTIVAAFQWHLAAAPSLVEEATLAPSVAALAARLDVPIARDRSRVMADLTRAVYSTLDARPPALSTFRPLSTPSAPGASLPRVPVPLPAAVWSAAVFRHVVPPDQLIATILEDRRASLLCHGLSGLDDETLTYLVGHPAIVTILYERGASAFAAFGDTLRIHAGRVMPPGGDAFAPLWEGVALAPLGQPELFTRQLFTQFDGQLAYLFDTIDSASPEAAKFALGAWMPDANQRLRRFKALFEATMGSYREWRVAEHPFSRPLGDLATLLLRVRVESSGEPAAPSGRAFWGAVFDVGPPPGEGGTADLIDAAWLTSAIGGDDMYSRIERLDQFAFGRRVFVEGDVAPDGGAVDVLRSFRRYRMLFLTIERMGIISPAVYIGAMQRAEALGELGGARRFWTVAQFQGAIAFLARLRRSGSIDRPRAQALVLSLSALPFQDEEYAGALAVWWRTELARVLPPAPSWEARATAALAGPSTPSRLPRVFWEGQDYRVDVVLADRLRMDTIRGKQGGHTLDLALALDDLAHRLRAATLTIAEVRAVEQALADIAREGAPRLKRPVVSLPPPGVVPPRDGLIWLAEVSQDLAQISHPADVRRASRAGVSLQQFSDIVLGDALLSLAYAADLGDPAGAALLAGNVALRHDFGFARKDAPGRLRMLWSLPRQDFQPGVPWHVAGSLLGLDIALAPLLLRRLSIDHMADAPKISSIEREALGVGIALLDPSRMTDPDRDAIVAAIGRGRARVVALAAGSLPADPLIDEIGMDGYRRRSLNWALQADPGLVAAQFSLGDLVTLGGGAGAADLDAWGPPALNSYGCACTRYVPSRAWRMLEGRLQLPMMAATMGDLTLAMALMLHDLHVPSALVRSVLSVGMLDVIDDLAETNGDWWALSRTAQGLSRQRVEDYVSSAAAVDGPLVPMEDASAGRDH